MDLTELRKRATERDEIRMVALPVTLRAAGEDEAPVLEGYAAVFDQETQIGGDAWGFMESVAPGAFTASLADDDVRACFNHSPHHVLGRTSAKTAEFVEDKTGLKATIYPPDTAVGRDVVTLVKRGDVTGMSFMFQVMKDEWTEPKTKGQLPKRRLLEVKLFEAGPVTFPAYEQTSISARDRAQAFLEANDEDAAAPVRRQAARNAVELEIAAIEL